jgi:hypothetical protein
MKMGFYNMLKNLWNWFWQSRADYHFYKWMRVKDRTNNPTEFRSYLACIEHKSFDKDN